MKKISLKNIKDSLSRSEMRVIKGGCGAGAGGCISTGTACPSGHDSDCCSKKCGGGENPVCCA